MKKIKGYKRKTRIMPIALIVLIIAVIILSFKLYQVRKADYKSVEEAIERLQKRDIEDSKPLMQKDEDTKADTPEIKEDKAKAFQRSVPDDPILSSRKPRLLEKGLYILIVKDQHQLRLYRDGKFLKSYRVALGKNPEDKQAVGDNRTPEGHFYINFIKDSHGWTHDFKDGKGEIAGAYGPWFMALFTGKANTFSQNTWTGIGIHGTHNPASIGTNETEGCIRLYNEELVELKNLIGEEKYVPVDIVASL